MSDFNSDLSKVLYSTESERQAFESAIEANPLDWQNHLVYSDWLRDGGDEHEADFQQAMGNWVREDKGKEESIRGGIQGAGPIHISPPYGSMSLTHSVWRDDLPEWAKDPNAPASVSETHFNRIRQEPHLAYAPNPYWLHWAGYRNLEEGLRRAFAAGRPKPTS